MLTRERLEDLLIAAFEHAIEVSGTHAYDLVRATGITSDELEAIGYDKINFDDMHSAAEEG